jgi:hypothetical protein
MFKARFGVMALAMAMTTSASAITLGGGGDARPVDLAQTYDLAADPAASAQTYVVLNGKPKDVKKVAIVSFCVGAVYGKGVAGSSSGASLGFSKSAIAGFPGGVPASDLMAAAAAMYDQFEAELKAAGIEVLSPEQLAALPSYQKLAGKMVSGPQDVEEKLDLGKGKSGANLLVVFSPGNRPFLKDCRQETPSTTTNKVKLMYEKDLDGITLASVKVTIDFAKPLAGGGFLQGAKADLQYGEYLTPGPNDNAVQFMNKSGSGSYWLKQALVAPQNPFKEGGSGEVKRSGEYDAFSGVHTATTTTTTTVDADHALWASNAEALMKSLAKMYVTALAGA